MVRKHKQTEETRKKLSIINSGKNHPQYGTHPSEETRKKQSESHKGKKPTQEALNKRSEAMKGKFLREKSPLWLGGYIPYSVDWTETLRRSIRERDHYICRMCSQYGSTVHHIDYNKTNNNPTNLITLCKTCHSKTNFDREYWRERFKYLKL